MGENVSTVVGIDLGTTNSLISVFTDEGSTLIPNGSGKFLTPSVVGFSDKKDIIVGETAKHRLISHPNLTTARFKRYMGTQREFKLGRKTFRAEDLSALVLKSLKADAEKHLGQPVERAIISVPAYFNDVQRKATYAAGKIAGLKVERLINEPTAAALAYGLNSKEDENTFLVVDLGGGTFDVSILEIFSGVMEVRSSAGDAFLGGEDFTDAIVKEFEKQLGKEADKLDDIKKGLLRDLANKAKIKLTQSEDVTVRFHGKKAETNLTISRSQFEDITKKLQDRLRKPIQRAIMDAGMRAEDIDRVVMVGGATRMPIIRKIVTRLLKVFPEHSLDPDEVIALGSAVQAGLLTRHKALDEIVMTDVCPFTLGTDVAVQTSATTYEAGHFQPIIERNTVIPASRVVRNATLQKGQQKIELTIYQGESPRVIENVKLGKIVKWVPVNHTNFEEVDIRFTYDVSGVLEVLVTSVSDQKTQRVVIEGNPGSLSQNEIDKRFKELAKLKIHPKDKSENAELMARLKAAYESHLGDIRTHINHLLTQFEAVLEKQNETDIKVSREELTKWLDELEASDVF